MGLLIISQFDYLIKMLMKYFQKR